MKQVNLEFFKLLFFRDFYIKNFIYDPESILVIVSLCCYR